MSRMKVAFDVLQDSPDGLTCAELSKRSDMTIMQASQALSKLHTYGKARRNEAWTRHVGRTYWPARPARKQSDQVTVASEPA